MGDREFRIDRAEEPFGDDEYAEFSDDELPSYVGSTTFQKRPLCDTDQALAASGAEITNLRHRTVILNEFERQLVALLDGSRDEAALMEALLDALARGELEIEQDGHALRDLAKARALFGAALGPTLNRLARLALFVG